MRPEILGLDFDEVTTHLERLGHLDPGPLIAEQAFRGLHGSLAHDFADIPGLSRRKIVRLEDTFALSRIQFTGTQPADDGSVRYMFRLDDGHVVESVLLPRHGRFSLCVSSQAGCALACQFCATGMLGLGRNLHTHEIVDQLLQVSRHSRCRIERVVFMGMGEPLQNEDAVFGACRIFAETVGLQISSRKILISTAGLVPAIRRFTRARHRMELVFSLVSAIPEKRAALMPVQRTYGFEVLLDAIREYAASRPGKPVTLEYIAIRGLTLGEEDIEAIREHLVGFPFILNVIPLNPVRGSGLEAPTRAEVKAWTARLRPLGFPVKVRWSFGQDRSCGCGQLGSVGEAVEAVPGPR